MNENTFLNAFTYMSSNCRYKQNTKLKTKRNLKDW